MDHLEKLTHLCKTTHANYMSRFLIKDAQLHNWVLRETAYLGDDADVKHRVYAILNDHPHRETCTHGRRPTFDSSKTGYKRFCGNIDSCGCYRDFKREQMQDVCASRSSEEKAAIREKAKATFTERYGVDNPSKSTNIKKKRTKTNILRYGADNPMKSEIVRDKVKATLNNRYQRDSYPQRLLANSQLATLRSKEELLGLLTKSTITGVASTLGVDRNTVARYAGIHDIVDQALAIGPTDLEEKVKQVLDQHDIKYVYRSRDVIGPFELDFYLPDQNAAIEVGALYWHSWQNCPDKNYHFNKWKLCRNAGITLYTWFNDDVRAHWPVIESKIQYLAGVEKPKIGARKTVLQKISNQSARELLDSNHIQGAITAQQYVLGAYHQDQLVGVMGFAYRKSYLELTRFATDLSATYPGLFSRMLSHSINDMQYKGDIVSFSDNAHSNGAVYAANGFVIDKVLGPAYWYTNDYQTRHNRQGFMKSKIARRFGIDMGNKTEWQAMQELGWDRVWDAGKIKWRRTV